MLLRASRNSVELTKRAHQIKEAIPGVSALRRAGQGVVKAVKDPLGTVGRGAMKHKMMTAAGVTGATAAGIGVNEGMQRASKGMDPPYPSVPTPGMYGAFR